MIFRTDKPATTYVRTAVGQPLLRDVDRGNGVYS